MGILFFFLVSTHSFAPFFGLHIARLSVMDVSDLQTVKLFLGSVLYTFACFQSSNALSVYTLYVYTILYWLDFILNLRKYQEQKVKK